MSTRQPVDPDARYRGKEPVEVKIRKQKADPPAGPDATTQPRKQRRPGSSRNLTSRKGCSSPESSVASSHNSGGSKRSVAFCSVEVREHSYTLGYVCPHQCREGTASLPPMELSWDVQAISISTLDDYEASRGRRRSLPELHQSEEDRLSILRNAGFGPEELSIGMVSHEEMEERRGSSEQPAPNHLYEDLKQKLQDEELDHSKKPRGRLGTLFRRDSKLSVTSLCEM
jgi:hypothetical protein